MISLRSTTRAAGLALAATVVLAGCAAPPERRGVSWERARSADDRTIVVSLWGSPGPYHPNDPCGADYHAEHREGSAGVVIVVWEDRAPGWDAAICPALARRVEAAVTLDAPLGDRTLFDGITGEVRTLDP